MVKIWWNQKLTSDITIYGISAGIVVLSEKNIQYSADFDHDSIIFLGILVGVLIMYPFTLHLVLSDIRQIAYWQVHDLFFYLLFSLDIIAWYFHYCQWMEKILKISWRIFSCSIIEKCAIKIKGRYELLRCPHCQHKFCISHPRRLVVENLERKQENDTFTHSAGLSKVSTEALFKSAKLITSRGGQAGVAGEKWQHIFDSIRGQRYLRINIFNNDLFICRGEPLHKSLDQQQ